MTLHPHPILPIPAQTATVARAAFPNGNIYLALRDELGTLYDDTLFTGLYPRDGQPALSPWQLALVTVLQFAEDLPDRQAADAVRSRIDWKYLLGLELTDPGFDYSVLCEFRARLVSGGATDLLLDRMLDVLKEKGILKPRGRQRTGSRTYTGTNCTKNRTQSTEFRVYKERRNSMQSSLPLVAASITPPR